MPIRLREWVQREWTNAGAASYRASGDFQDLDSLLPTPNRLELKRAPTWSGHAVFPTGFDTCKAAFYDHANQRVVFIGQNGSSQLASAYADVTSSWSMTGPHTLVASTLSPGGLDHLNARYWGGDLYVIASDSTVYRGSSYTSTLSAFYSAADAKALCPFADRMLLATTGGDIVRLNDADSAFESCFAPVGDLDIRFMAPFRGYLLVVTRDPSGDLLIHKLPPDASSPTLTTLATVPAATDDQTLAGLQGATLFALHDDKLYLTPGRDTLLDGSKGLNVYGFNGSQVSLVAQQSLSTASPIHFGLIPWRDHLLLYDISTTAQSFKALVGSHFTDCLPDQSRTIPTHSILYNPGGELFFPATSGVNEGLHYLSASSLSDGFLVTPRLDMGSPARQKRLEQITVLLDGAASDFKVPIKYRTDDNTSWTTAATANNTRRATATAIAQPFYTLQLRIDLDDDTGANQDIRIEAISVLYSIDT